MTDTPVGNVEDVRCFPSRLAAFSAEAGETSRALKRFLHRKVYASSEYKKFLEEQYADPNSFEDASKAPAFVNEQLGDMKKTMVTN